MEYSAGGYEYHHRFGKWCCMPETFVTRLADATSVFSSPGESKWPGILVLQRTEVGRVCVRSWMAGEAGSLPQGRRAGKGQCGETSRNAPSVKQGHTVPRTISRHSAHSARCPAQPHVVSQTFIQHAHVSQCNTDTHTRERSVEVRSGAQHVITRVHLTHVSAPQPRVSNFESSIHPDRPRWSQSA